MDKLFLCASAFEKLTNIRYIIKIGKRGKLTELTVEFNKIDFHHLAGLGKLKDLRIAKENRIKVFDSIIDGTTTPLSILLTVSLLIFIISANSSCVFFISSFRVMYKFGPMFFTSLFSIDPSISSPP